MQYIKSNLIRNELIETFLIHSILSFGIANTKLEKNI